MRAATTPDRGRSHSNPNIAKSMLPLTPPQLLLPRTRGRMSQNTARLQRFDAPTKWRACCWRLMVVLRIVMGGDAGSDEGFQSLTVEGLRLSAPGVSPVCLFPDSHLSTCA